MTNETFDVNPIGEWHEANKIHGYPIFKNGSRLIEVTETHKRNKFLNNNFPFTVTFTVNQKTKAQYVCSSTNETESKIEELMKMR